MVLTREEVAEIIPLVEGVPLLVVKLLYGSGSGLRILEALRLRVQHVDVPMRQVTVRSGNRDRDQVTTFPASLAALLFW